MSEKQSVSKVEIVKVREISLVALMAAFICVMGPFSIPIGPVPIALANFGIYVNSVVLGSKKGALATIVYLLIGFCGVPVFTGFTGGVAKLTGPTGGYLIGYVFMAFITGYFAEKFYKKISMIMLGMVLGTIVIYAMGTVWLAYQANMSFQAALEVGVLPFVICDLIKMVGAIMIGIRVKKQLLRDGILDIE